MSFLAALGGFILAWISYGASHVEEAHLRRLGDSKPAKHLCVIMLAPVFIIGMSVAAEAGNSAADSFTIGWAVGFATVLIGVVVYTYCATRPKEVSNSEADTD